MSRDRTADELDELAESFRRLSLTSPNVPRFTFRDVTLPPLALKRRSLDRRSPLPFPAFPPFPYFPMKIFPLLRLPRELLLLVMDHLDQKSHSRLARICWYTTIHLQEDLFHRYNSPGDYQAMYYGCRTVVAQSSATAVAPAFERAISYGVPTVPSSANDVIFMGMTPLSVAAFNGNLGVVRYLLEKMRADVDGTGETGFTPLAYALTALPEANLPTRSELFATLTMLLSKGANPNCDLFTNSATGARPQNALTLVLETYLIKSLNEIQVAQLMIALAWRGASADGYSQAPVRAVRGEGRGIAMRAEGWSPLAYAIHGSSLEPRSTRNKYWQCLMTALLSKGADPNFGRERGNGWFRNPLGTAILGRRTDTIKCLAAHGAYLNPRPGDRFASRLYLAIRNVLYDCVVTLLELGADPNVVEVQHDSSRLNPMIPYSGFIVGTPLCASIATYFFLAHHGTATVSVNIFHALLSANADVNLADSHGHTPLTVAITLAIGGDQAWQITGRSRARVPARRSAIFVHALLRHGADPNKTNEANITPLGLCLTSKWEDRQMRTEVVRALIAAGADVNTCGPGMPDKAFPPRAVVIKALIAAGVKVSSCDPGMLDTASPLLEVLKDFRHLSPDVLWSEYMRLIDMYIVQSKKLSSAGAFKGLPYSQRRVRLTVPEDGWRDPVVPLLVNAGAEMGPHVTKRAWRILHAALQDFKDRQ